MADGPEPTRLSRIDLVWGLAAGLLIEAVTCVLRFGFRLQSTRDTGFLRRFTFGVRIHHGYIGLLALAWALGMMRDGRRRRWVVRLGLALVLSDLIHHFVVLWITTGSPQFDLVYPR